MSLPPGVDLDTLVFLERHETQVHALPGREMRDLGDALLLYDRLDREPFWNRIGAVRWPNDPSAFDRRLAETIALFAGLDRIPHVWPRPALNEPRDLAARLIAHGWEDAGGGLVMLLVDPEPVLLAARQSPPAGVTVEPLDGLSGDDARRAAADVSMVLAESFEVEPARRAAIELETLAMSDHPEAHACLVRVDGEPAAVAKRTTFEGASYLSSIGTRPAFRGRGLGRLATAIVSADAVRAGSRWTYLGVFTENDPALALYHGLGFEVVGDPSADLVLR
jgi:ribosomal protein S18 acetylase RimI-like enzyme